MRGLRDDHKSQLLRDPESKGQHRGRGLSPTCTWDPAHVINDIFLKICFPVVFSVAGIWEEF